MIFSRIVRVDADRPPSTTHLKSLEAESIHILREVAGQARAPVMMYSIGKDSSVLLHLARKAFFPGRLPFPLLHIDTLWKFRDMIAFRDETARRLDLDLRVFTSPEGRRRNVNPFDHDSITYNQVMKTDALKQALTEGDYDFAIGGARRDEERSRAKERVFSIRAPGQIWDPKRQRPGTLDPLQRPARAGRDGAGVPAVELDRARRLVLRRRSSASRSCRCISRRCGRPSSGRGR